MATYTDNYHLIQPSEDDYYDIEQMNSNMGTIDSVMAATEQTVDTIGEKIDSIDQTLTDTEGTLDEINTKVTNANTSLSELMMETSISQNIMSKVNSRVTATQNTLEDLSCALGTPEGEETILSLLQGGLSVIKSIQRVVYEPADSGNSGSVSINPVNPTKTIVFSERLRDTTDGHISYSYTLSETEIALTHSSGIFTYLAIGFWVLEFI